MANLSGVLIPFYHAKWTAKFYTKTLVWHICHHCQKNLIRTHSIKTKSNVTTHQQLNSKSSEEVSDSQLAIKNMIAKLFSLSNQTELRFITKVWIVSKVVCFLGLIGIKMPDSKTFAKRTGFAPTLYLFHATKHTCNIQVLKYTITDILAKESACPLLWPRSWFKTLIWASTARI